MNIERTTDRTGDEPWPEQDIAAELRLRPERPRVVRLSRNALGLIAGVSALALGGALIFALQTSGSAERQELFDTENRTTAGGLERLPQDYTGLPRQVPQLGPPLPGDLGRPMLEAGVQPPPVAGEAALPPAQPQYQPPPQLPPSPYAERIAQARQQLAQEREAARLSRLFAGETRTQPATAAQPDIQSSAGADHPGMSPAAGGSQGFLNAAVDRRTASLERVQPPPGRHVVQSGSVIAAALITGLRSDLPGQVTAQVTENIYDSPTGRTLLIPQGSRLVGQYDAQVSFGQSRALLVWTRLIMPNGRSMVLERQPGADAAGYAGLQDKVDAHWGQIFRAALVSSLLAIGGEAGSSGDESDLIRAIRRGTSDSISQTGRQIVGRSLDVQPTLTVRPGFPVKVVVTRDLILEPYSD